MKISISSPPFSGKAEDVSIVDAGGYYTGTEVETALQEIGAGTTLDGRYVNITGDAMTGQLFIDGGSDQIQLRIQGFSSQTANLQTWENSIGSVLTYIDPVGRFYAPRFGFNTNTYMEAGSPGYRFYDSALEVLRASSNGLTFLVSGSTIGTFRSDKWTQTSASANASGRNMVLQASGSGLTATNSWGASWYFGGDSFTNRIVGVRNDGSVLFGNNGGLSFPTARIQVYQETNGTDVAHFDGATGHTANLSAWRVNSVVQANITAGGGAVFNEQGNDSDFRIEGDTDANLVFVDASTDRVGVGTATPSYKHHVNGTQGAMDNDSVVRQIQSHSAVIMYNDEVVSNNDEIVTL